MSVLKAIIIVLQAWTIKATLPNKKRVASFFKWGGRIFIMGRKMGEENTKYSSTSQQMSQSVETMIHEQRLIWKTWKAKHAKIRLWFLRLCRLFSQATTPPTQQHSLEWKFWQEFWRKNPNSLPRALGRQDRKKPLMLSFNCLLWSDTHSKSRGSRIFDNVWKVPKKFHFSLIFKCCGQRPLIQQ